MRQKAFLILILIALTSLYTQAAIPVTKMKVASFSLHDPISKVKKNPHCHQTKTQYSGEIDFDCELSFMNIPGTALVRVDPKKGITYLSFEHYETNKTIGNWQKFLKKLIQSYGKPTLQSTKRIYELCWGSCEKGRYGDADDVDSKYGAPSLLLILSPQHPMEEEEKGDYLSLSFSIE